MKKIKNKFIIFIILIIVSIIGYGIFSSYLQKNKLNSSYVTLIEGEALLNMEKLILNTQNILNIGDNLETVGNNSKAVIEWGDGSITRLGGNTSLKIEELYVSSDISKLNIAFELLKGKTWSNVISFLGEDSYFKEYFRDSEAAARGTIFNIDLESDYIYVNEHNISLTDSSGKNTIIKEKTPFDINKNTFIKLEEFIRNIKDKAWENFNLDKDNQFFNLLKKDIEENISSLLKINQLNINDYNNENDKKDLYNKILSNYQKLHFIKPDEKDLFNHKIELKEKLILLAQEKNKQILVENTLYDFNNIIKMKEYENIDNIIFILSENKEFIDKINLNNYIQIPNLIPEDLKNIFEDNILDIKDIFGKNLDNINNLNIDNIKDNIGNIHDNAKNIIHKGLDTLFDK